MKCSAHLVTLTSISETSTLEESRASLNKLSLIGRGPYKAKEISEVISRNFHLVSYFLPVTVPIFLCGLSCLASEDQISGRPQRGLKHGQYLQISNLYKGHFIVPNRTCASHSTHSKSTETQVSPSGVGVFIDNCHSIFIIKNFVFYQELKGFTFKRFTHYPPDDYFVLARIKSVSDSVGMVLTEHSLCDKS